MGAPASLVNQSRLYMSVVVPLLSFTSIFARCRSAHSSKIGITMMHQDIRSISKNAVQGNGGLFR